MSRNTIEENIMNTEIPSDEDRKKEILRSCLLADQIFGWFEEQEIPPSEGVPALCCALGQCAGLMLKDKLEEADELFEHMITEIRGYFLMYFKAVTSDENETKQ